MSIRKLMERLAWRLAGFRGSGIVQPTSRIRVAPNPLELAPDSRDRFLIFSPHPDDDAIGCGGLIGSGLARGATIHVVYATDGGLGGIAAVRRQEALSARDVCLAELGRTYETRFLNHKELSIDRPKLASEIESLIAELSPSYILLPHPGDNHTDHFEVSRAVRDVALCTDLRDCQILGYEVWSTLVMGAFVDISAFENLKRMMISAHLSQTAHKDYAAMILALNLYRGACLPTGVRLAEAFELVSDVQAGF